MYPNYPLPPSETLPTMYDLPSEDPEEPGLPDEFHCFQPQLLRETCQLPNYPSTEIFIGTDINLYYDVRNSLWHKRPDWFLVLGVPASEQQQQMRWSYVVWQEGVAPFLVVELLSPGTEAEDLGQKLRSVDKPPNKWQVYEQILRIPYYIVFDRYENRLQVFELHGGRYHSLELEEEKIWLDELQLGLGVWQGVYQGIEGKWLRWYNQSGYWLPTPFEQASEERGRTQQALEQVSEERGRTQQALEQVERLAAQLRELGINPDMI